MFGFNFTWKYSTVTEKLATHLRCAIPVAPRILLEFNHFRPLSAKNAADSFSFLAKLWTNYPTLYIFACWSWVYLGGSMATARRHLPLPLRRLWPRRGMPHKAMPRLSDSIHSWRTPMPSSCRSLCSFVVSMAFYDTYSLDCFWMVCVVCLLSTWEFIRNAF